MVRSALFADNVSCSEFFVHFALVEASGCAVNMGLKKRLTANEESGYTKEDLQVMDRDTDNWGNE